MNINIKLPVELEERIAAEANERLSEVIEDILKNDEELDALIKKTIQGQVKAEALRCLQSTDLRSKMAQKVYPIIYETLGLVKKVDVGFWDKDGNYISDYQTEVEGEWKNG